MNKRLSVKLSSLFSLLCLGLALPPTAHAETASRTLIVFFSQPEQVDLKGADAMSGASVLLKNQKVLGNTEYIANIIHEQTNADLFRIETTVPYPVLHDPLVKYAENELRQNARPALKNRLEHLDHYDTIFIGYPIWWYKLPMPLYSFLETYHLDGKTIIPFSTHGGSRFSGSIEEIARLQPQARVIKDGLTISRNDVAKDRTSAQVIKWLGDVYPVKK